MLGKAVSATAFVLLALLVLVFAQGYYELDPLNPYTPEPSMVMDVYIQGDAAYATLNKMVTTVEKIPASPAGTPGAPDFNPDMQYYIYGDPGLEKIPVAGKPVNFSVFVLGQTHPIPNCQGQHTNASGVAECPNIRQAIDQIVTTAPFQQKCGELYATWDGDFDNPAAKSQPWPFCRGLSIIPMENTKSSILNETCFGLVILLGLLFAAMYGAGKSPLTLFDMTSPRMPAPKKFQFRKITHGDPYGVASKAFGGAVNMYNTNFDKLLNHATGLMVAGGANSAAIQRIVKSNLTKEAKIVELKKTAWQIADQGQRQNAIRRLDSLEEMTRVIDSQEVAGKATSEAIGMHIKPAKFVKDHFGPFAPMFSIPLSGVTKVYKTARVNYRFVKGVSAGLAAKAVGENNKLGKALTAASGEYAPLLASKIFNADAEKKRVRSRIVEELKQKAVYEMLKEAMKRIRDRRIAEELQAKVSERILDINKEMKLAQEGLGAYGDTEVYRKYGVNTSVDEFGNMVNGQLDALANDIVRIASGDSHFAAYHARNMGRMTGFALWNEVVNNGLEARVLQDERNLTIDPTVDAQLRALLEKKTIDPTTGRESAIQEYNTKPGTVEEAVEWLAWRRLFEGRMIKTFETTGVPADAKAEDVGAWLDPVYNSNYAKAVLAPTVLTGTKEQSLAADAAKAEVGRDLLEIMKAEVREEYGIGERQIRVYGENESVSVANAVWEQISSYSGKARADLVKLNALRDQLDAENERREAQGLQGLHVDTTHCKQDWEAVDLYRETLYKFGVDADAVMAHALGNWAEARTIDRLNIELNQNNYYNTQTGLEYMKLYDAYAVELDKVMGDFNYTAKREALEQVAREVGVATGGITRDNINDVVRRVANADETYRQKLIAVGKRLGLKETQVRSTRDIATAVESIYMRQGFSKEQAAKKLQEEGIALNRGWEKLDKAGVMYMGGSVTYEMTKAAPWIAMPTAEWAPLPTDADPAVLSRKLQDIKMGNADAPINVEMYVAIKDEAGRILRLEQLDRTRHSRFGEPLEQTVNRLLQKNELIFKAKTKDFEGELANVPVRRSIASAPGEFAEKKVLHPLVRTIEAAAVGATQQDNQPLLRAKAFLEYQSQQVRGFRGKWEKGGFGGLMYDINHGQERKGDLTKAFDGLYEAMEAKNAAGITEARAKIDEVLGEMGGKTRVDALFSIRYDAAGLRRQLKAEYKWEQDQYQKALKRGEPDSAFIHQKRVEELKAELEKATRRERYGNETSTYFNREQKALTETVKRFKKDKTSEAAYEDTFRKVTNQMFLAETTRFPLLFRVSQTATASYGAQRWLPSINAFGPHMYLNPFDHYNGKYEFGLGWSFLITPVFRSGQKFHEIIRVPAMHRMGFPMLNEPQQYKKSDWSAAFWSFIKPHWIANTPLGDFLRRPGEEYKARATGNTHPWVNPGVSLDASRNAMSMRNPWGIRQSSLGERNSYYGMHYFMTKWFFNPRFPNEDDHQFSKNACLSYITPEIMSDFGMRAYLYNPGVRNVLASTMRGGLGPQTNWRMAEYMAKWMIYEHPHLATNQVREAADTDIYFRSKNAGEQMAWLLGEYEIMQPWHTSAWGFALPPLGLHIALNSIKNKAAMWRYRNMSMEADRTRDGETGLWEIRGPEVRQTMWGMLPAARGMLKAASILTGPAGMYVAYKADQLIERGLGKLAERTSLHDPTVAAGPLMEFRRWGKSWASTISSVTYPKSTVNLYLKKQRAKNTQYQPITPHRQTVCPHCGHTREYSFHSHTCGACGATHAFDAFKQKRKEFRIRAEDITNPDELSTM